MPLAEWAEKLSAYCILHENRAESPEFRLFPYAVLPCETLKLLST
jgi:hypothetical protein